MKDRHKWDFTPKRKTVDSGVSGCKNCDCVREFVGGKAIYFLNDSVFHQAPKCKATIILN